MSFNMNKYKRRPSQVNEAINILRKPSLSVEPGSPLHHHIAGITGKSSNKGNTSKSAEKIDEKTSFISIIIKRKRLLISLIILVLFCALGAIIYAAKRAENQSFPPPPNVEELPSNNCSAFTKAGNVPSMIISI
jgi:hypothetical protein